MESDLKCNINHLRLLVSMSFVSNTSKTHFSQFDDVFTQRMYWKMLKASYSCNEILFLNISHNFFLPNFTVIDLLLQDMTYSKGFHCQ